MTHNLAATFALSLMLVLAVTDMKTGLMPNRVTLGALLCALMGRWGLEGSAGLTAAILGALVTGLVPLGLFLSTGGKAIGGGDVKALLALGALLGPTRGLEAEMLSFMILAGYVLAREATRGNAGALLRRSLGLVVSRGSLAAGAREPSGSAPAGSGPLLEVRFGPALALGTLVICLGSWSVGV